MIETRQGAILEELQGYLLRHEQQICDYQRRQEAGKPIGSGRGEKANDRMIAQKQKKRHGLEQAGGRGFGYLTVSGA